MAGIKNSTVFEMTKGETVEGFFIVRSSEVVEDSSGIRYMNIVVQDKTGSISCTKQLADEDGENIDIPKRGNLLKIRGVVAENASHKEIHISLMRNPNEQDVIDDNRFEHTNLASAKKGDVICDFYIVKQAAERTDSKGNLYLDMNLGDKTGEINCKLWNWKSNSTDTRETPADGSAIFVNGLVDEYNGRMQLKLNKMQPFYPTSENMMELVPCAPETPESMENEITSTIDSFESEKLKAVVREVISLTGDTLKYFPAAQRLHHAERSGLLHHTVSMLRTANRIIEAYPYLNGDLLRAGVILHDLSKTVEMKSDEWGNVTDYTRDGLLIGHLVRGVTVIDKAAANVGVSGELLILLEHMVLSHHGEAEFGSPKQPAFPEAEALHWIDLFDARMNEIEGIMNRTPEGEFSEKIWSLDNRRMYHPKYDDDAE